VKQLFTAAPPRARAPRGATPKRVDGDALTNRDLAALLRRDRAPTPERISRREGCRRCQEPRLLRARAGRPGWPGSRADVALACGVWRSARSPCRNQPRSEPPPRPPLADPWSRAPAGNCAAWVAGAPGGRQAARAAWPNLLCQPASIEAWRRPSPRRAAYERVSQQTAHRGHRAALQVRARPLPRQRDGRGP